MRWLRRGKWKVSIVIAALLLLLMFMVWVPASKAGASESTSRLAILGPVQTTPTEDATVTALNKEKLLHENDWWWSNGATILSSVLSALVLVGGGLFGFWQWRTNRNDTLTNESNDRKEAQDKDLRAQAEERFKTAVAALGDKNEGTQVGGAILLRSFLHEDDKKLYGRYYRQIFDLAVAYLRISNIPKPSEDPDGLSGPPVDLNTPSPLTPLSRALITVFKESFPKTRDMLKKPFRDLLKQYPDFFDASRVHVDNGYFVLCDLKEIWMRDASLRDADLSEADMSGANLCGACLDGAVLSKANLSGADLIRANIENARSLEGTNLRGVKGLDDKQKAACKAKGAIVDEDAIVSSSQSTVSPLAPPQITNA